MQLYRAIHPLPKLQSHAAVLDPSSQRTHKMLQNYPQIWTISTENELHH